MIYSSYSARPAHIGIRGTTILRYQDQSSRYNIKSEWCGNGVFTSGHASARAILLVAYKSITPQIPSIPPKETENKQGISHKSKRAKVHSFRFAEACIFRIACRWRSVMLPRCMPSAMALPTCADEASRICCTDPHRLRGRSGLVGGEWSPNGSRLCDRSSRTD